MSTLRCSANTSVCITYRDGRATRKCDTSLCSSMLNTTTVSGMRHLGTLIAAVVIGPSAWILLAFGQDRSAQAFAHAQNTALHTGDFVRPVEYLAAAGLLLGLLATLRVSPLGSVLTGLGFAL